jgi:hypothetical protein
LPGDGNRVAETPWGLCLGGRLKFDLGWFAAAQLAAAFRLGVDLGTEEKREGAEPEPGQEHDHCRKGAPGLVVGAELADVDGEQAGSGKPDQDGERRAEAEEAPARMVDIRAEVEDAGEGEEEPRD